MTDPICLPVAGTSDLPAGTSRHATLRRGRAVLLANVGGAVCVVRDECTHEGAPRSEGGLEGATIR